MTAEPISELDLHAFIDGELDDARAGQIAAMLDSDPALAERVDRYRADMARLATLYDPVLAWPPNGLLRERPAPAPRLVGRRAVWFGLAAAMAVLAFGIVWRSVSGDTLVAAAIAARDGTLATGDLLQDSDLSARLGQPVHAPDLGRAGWRLARIEAFRGILAGRFVELSYTDTQGRLFTIALQAKPGEGFEVSPRGRLQVCVWHSDTLEAVMLGEMSQAEMLRTATMTYADLGF